MHLVHVTYGASELSLAYRKVLRHSHQPPVGQSSNTKPVVKHSVDHLT